MTTETQETPRTFEDYGLTIDRPGITLEEASKDYNLDDPTELAVQTYIKLGFVFDPDKTLREFGKSVDSLQADLPESVTTQPHDIALPPKLGELTLEQLIERHNALTGQHDNPDTSVWSDLWNQYTPGELNQGQTRPIEARAVLLGTDNAYDEPGLYFIDQDLGKQIESLIQAQKEHDGEATELSSVSPAEYIIRNAMQLERGEPLQDTSTFTRFAELDEKQVYGHPIVSGATLCRGQLSLQWSGGVQGGRGVRLSVGPKRTSAGK